MLDSLVATLVDEVALEGPEGCSLERFWLLAETAGRRQLAAMGSDRDAFVLDDQYKGYLWQWIRQLPLLFSLESNKEVKVSSLSYADINQQYGKRLIIRVSSEQHAKVIYQGLRPSQKTILPQQYEILGLIARSRWDGITQAQLAESLQLDPRNVFRHLKALVDAGLIIKQPAIHKGSYTNICFHRRFATTTTPQTSLAANDETSLVGPDGSVRLDMVLKRMTEILTRAPNHTMALQDIIYLLGFTTHKHIRWARAFILKLHEEGYLEKVKAVTDQSRVHCVRLLKSLCEAKIMPPSTNDTEQAEEKSMSQETIYTSTTSPPSSIPADLSLEQIIYKHIMDAGGQGLTRQGIEESIPGTNAGLVMKTLDQFSADAEPAFASFQVYRIAEVKGREHRYRYFGRPGWETYMSQQNGQVVDTTSHPVNVIAQIEYEQQEPTSFDFMGKQILGSSKKRTRPKADSTPPSIAESSQLKRTRSQKEDQQTPTATKFAPTLRSLRMPNAAQDTSSADKTVYKRKRSPSASPGDTETPSRRIQNITLENRRRMLLDILQRDLVREVDHILIEEMRQLEESSGVKHKLARRTVISLVDGMVTANLIKRVKLAIPGYSGRVEMRIVIFRSDMSDSGEQVQSFLNAMKEKWLTNTHSTHRNLAEIQGPIRRVTVDGRRTVNVEQKDPSKKKTDQFWRYVAIRHGWVPSKWFRARLFHQFMFEQSQWDEEDGSPIRQVMIHGLVNHMPLSLFCKVIGIYAYHQEIESFMETNETPDILMKHLPEHVKLAMIPQGFRLRRCLLSTLAVLEALELVHPVGEYTPRMVPRIYRVHLVGSLRNYASPERPVLNTIPFETSEDVTTYWNELQHLCSTVYAQPVNLSRNRGGPLDSICVRGAWDNGLVLSPSQKKTFDEHMEQWASIVAQGEENDDQYLIQQLSKTTGLLPSRVRSYYRHVTALQHRPQIKGAKTRHTLTGSTGEAIQALVRLSTEQGSVPKTKLPALVEPTFVGSRGKRPMRSQPDGIPFLRRPPSRRPTYVTWTDVEVDLLVHSYAIIRHRAGTGRVSWAPITTVIEGKSQQTCQRKMAALMTLPSMVRRVNQLERMWSDYYHQGLSSGAFVDDHPTDLQSFDLAGQLEYFLICLKNEPISTTSPHLFRDPAMIEERYHVVATFQNHRGDDMDLTTKATALGSRSTKDEEGPDPMLLVESLVKMTLVTPVAKYSSDRAFSLLLLYPPETVETATLSLRNQGVLAQAKAWQTKRLPGRRYNISEKFLSSMAGPYSISFCHDAFTFARSYTIDQNVPNFPSRGTMACILTLLSTCQATMLLKDREQFMAWRRSLVYPKPKKNELAQKWIDRETALILRIEDHLQADPSPHHPAALTLSIPTEETIQSMVTALGCEAIHVYDVLKTFGTRGATLVEMKQKVSLGTQDELLLFRAIHRLLHHEPSLILRVGWHSDRWVTLLYASPWLVQTPKPSTYLIPRVWTDIDGQLIPEAFQGCADALLGHVVASPGISHAKLCVILADCLTRIELRELTTHLVSIGAIYARTLMRPVVSLFSPTQPASLTRSCRRSTLGETALAANEHTMDGSMTYYWPSTMWWSVRSV